MPHSIGYLILCTFVICAYGMLCWSVFRPSRLPTTLAARRGRLPAPTVRLLTALYWANPLCILGLWGILSYTGLAPAHLLPTPTRLAISAWRLLSSGTLFLEASISLLRVLVGFSCAALVGVSIGLVSGAFVPVRQVVLPANSFLRYIPPTAFIALLIVYFGVGEMYKYAVVFFGIVFFIVQMVVDVVDDVDARQVDMAETSGLADWQIFVAVVVPASMPRILDVLRINLGAAWTFLVAAELIGSERGLGHLIAVSQRYLRLGDLFTGILAFGVIGLVADQILELVARKWFRWYYIALRR